MGQSLNDMKMLARSLKHPATWCFGIHIILSELISFNLDGALDGGTFFAAGPLYFHVAAILLFVLLFLFQKSIGTLLQHGWLPAICAVIGSIGMLVVVLSGDMESTAYRVVGFLAAVAGMQTMFLMIMECFWTGRRTILPCIAGLSAARRAVLPALRE